MESAQPEVRLVMLVAVSVALGIRLSDVLRIAEDSAEWHPAPVWTETPHEYLGFRVVEDARDMRQLERVGYRVSHIGAHDCTSTSDPMLRVVHCAGLLLRRARQHQHLHLEDVGRASGLGLTVLSRLELSRNRTTLSRLVIVCLVLRVRPSDVIRLAEDQVFPEAVWSDTPQPSASTVAVSISRVVTAVAVTPVDLHLPTWVVPLYSTSAQTTDLFTPLTAPDARHAARRRARRCAARSGHDTALSAEVSVELRDGVPVDIWRCVLCGQPVPLSPPPDRSMAVLSTDEVTL